jgi:hypothetical protein
VGKERAQSTGWWRNALEEITKACLNGTWIKSELVFIGKLCKVKINANYLY